MSLAKVARHFFASFAPPPSFVEAYLARVSEVVGMRLEWVQPLYPHGDWTLLLHTPEWPRRATISQDTLELPREVAMNVIHHAVVELLGSVSQTSHKSG